MLLRSKLPLFNHHVVRLFHSSAARRNHYETLQISIDASPKDVKHSFYALSKTHHPDRNPNDPTASERFIKINDAYATLGTPAKRQAYDRDVMRSQKPVTPTHAGSYSSANPAGGRPASGLSRRRTQFHGPPTSFYKSGGWGAHSAKRSAAQQNGAPGAERPADTEGEGWGLGGMGPGQKGWGHGNDVPHFDKEGHFGTHENINQRRRQRMEKAEDRGVRLDESRGLGMFGQFVLLGGLLTVGILIPSWIFEKISAKTIKKSEIKKYSP